jgi:DNA ligase-1
MTKQKIFKPMLASAIEDLGKVSYPVLASPKLDGIRCVIRNGKALSRSLKPIPNKVLREYLESLPKLEGLDGELMIDDVSFQEITSCVMSPNDNPHSGWYYGVFDKHTQTDLSFIKRLRIAESTVEDLDNHRVLFVDHDLIDNEEQLLSFESDCLAEGFEGVMLRDPEGRYKYGRSTLREGGLLKLKRFLDDEAVVVGVVEQMHNDNEAFTGELGQTKRSTAKAGKRPANTLGALVVEHKTFGQFEIGTGFTQAQRDDIWTKDAIGQLVKFKYQPVGVKDKPRCPVFLGFRSTEDL